MPSPIHVCQAGDYGRLVGRHAIDRLKAKAKPLAGRHITHISSTYYGGGVAELLSSLTLLMHSLGIRAGWRIIQGSSDFFGVTKRIHNALQGAKIDWTPRKQQIYEGTVYCNALRNNLDHEFVIVHDPQPLPLVEHYRKRGPWIWRCHVDLTAPNPRLWSYLRHFVERYDAAVLSLPEYRRKLKIPQLCFAPALDPFSVKNREMSKREIDERLRHYQIPTDLPLVVQVSRFDRWKDPEGVIEAFQITRKRVDARLVLLGGPATDDPEGEEVYDDLLRHASDRVLILSYEDTALVNALQRKAAVVVQKSIREGFGLTVTEAMWKGAAVVGGDVGGIRHQIQDGQNGFLVTGVRETADRIAHLLRNPALRARMGAAARKSVQERFLMTRLLEQWLDLFNSFETVFRMKGR